jgi:hypothetical protein
MRHGVKVACVLWVEEFYPLSVSKWKDMDRSESRFVLCRSHADMIVLISQASVCLLLLTEEDAPSLMLSSVDARCNGLSLRCRLLRSCAIHSSDFDTGGAASDISEYKLPMTHRSPLQQLCATAIYNN